MSTLLELIQTKVNYVVQEAIVVIKDIFRKYPNKYESIISTLCENLDTLDEPEARASMVSRLYVDIKYTKLYQYVILILCKTVPPASTTKLSVPYDTKVLDMSYYLNSIILKLVKDERLFYLVMLEFVLL